MKLFIIVSLLFCYTSIIVSPPKTLADRNFINEPVAQKSKTSKFSFEDENVNVRVVSVKQSRGEVTMVLMYTNLLNINRRYAIYDGGANGRDTYLTDSKGGIWKWQHGSFVNSLGPKVFISNLPTEVTLTFVKEKGDTNVQFFYLTNWIHILEPTGATPNAYWSAVEIQKIPTEYGS